MANTTTESIQTPPRRRGRPPKSAVVQSEKGSDVAELLGLREVERSPSTDVETADLGEDMTTEKGSEVERELSLEDVLNISGDAQLLPAQFEADPWGDTPLQMRQGA